LTLALPAVAVMGNVLAVNLNKKVKDYVFQAGLLFFVSALMILGVILTNDFKLFYVTLFAFTVVSLMVASNNSLITCVFPLFMKEKVNSGAIAGILNGCCYVGSTLSSYGLGLINKLWGWTAVFYVLLGFALVAVIGTIIYLAIKKSITNKNL
jgi:OPA family glycerol-3-phosphate transporter-like MFS transporter